MLKALGDPLDRPVVTERQLRSILRDVAKGQELLVRKMLAKA
jgi:hypothetical protein